MDMAMLALVMRICCFLEFAVAISLRSRVLCCFQALFSHIWPPYPESALPTQCPGGLRFHSVSFIAVLDSTQRMQDTQ